MMMQSLDRFSQPLNSERHFTLDTGELEQQNLRNKLGIVDRFISQYWDIYGIVPQAEYVQDLYCELDLALNLIEERIRRF